jgi:hypothetical protein
VLVTSHSTKALRVVRDHVVPSLQTLCVSVLEDDIQTRSELQSSVHEINDRLVNSDTDLLDATAEQIAFQRAQIAHALENRRADLLKARFDEYREIVIAGDGYSPVEAAGIVASGVARNDWISAGVLPGAPLPLCRNELAELYRTARAVAAHDELEAMLGLPDPAMLPSPDEFDVMIKERASLAAAEMTTGSQFWGTKPCAADIARLEDLCNRIKGALTRIDDGLLVGRHQLTRLALGKGHVKAVVIRASGP